MVQSHLFALKTFFNYQQETGSLTINPFSILSFPTPDKKQRATLSREQIERLYQACESLRDKALLSLFYGCGLRKSEAERLNVSDIHFKQQILYVKEGKGKKRRAIPLSAKVVADLENYLDYERSFYIKENESTTNTFMLNNNGRRMQGDSYWKRLKKLLAKAGLPRSFSLHHLRHSIATHLLESGLSLEQVRDFLGHSELETTQIYTRVSRKYLHSQL